LNWQAAVVSALKGQNRVRTEVAAASVLIALDLALITVARMRFRRARLILD
jgi:hypothetical protein